jgi:hypothetical protein
MGRPAPGASAPHHRIADIQLFSLQLLKGLSRRCDTPRSRGSTTVFGVSFRRGALVSLVSCLRRPVGDGLCTTNTEEPTMSLKPIAALWSRVQSAALVATLAATLSMVAPRPAQALTLVIDFTTTSMTDIFGSTVTPADYTPYGFTSMNLAQIQSSILAAVTNDYLGYPTVAANPLSPLPVGKELNLNIAITTNHSAPSNGDTEYYYFGVGKKAGSEPEFGHACYGCVRDDSAQPANVPNQSNVGVIFTDNIANLEALATTDAQRINLLAGTIAHELGHTLFLDHPNRALANPGASSFSLMATGAFPTSMPNDQRILDRAFAYAEFSQLIASVGLRDVAAVPEADGYLMFAVAVAGLLAMGRRQRLAAIA